jgi:ferric-dicitrate binding protein FerR (iron transport regulator)
VHFEGPVPIELASSGQVLLELVPGTDLTLPAPPGRWWARSAHIALRSGEIRVSTGEKFHGARLQVTTSEAEVHVTGTTFAVICFPEGTCVCVCEGTVAVGEHGKEPVPISAGHRRFIYNSGKPPLIDAILPREEVQLGRMCAGRDSALGGR